MTQVEHVYGDLLTLETQGTLVIAQQCNCITRKSHGLSQSIAERLQVDPYEKRSGPSANLANAETSSTPGKVSMHVVKDSTKGPNYVACLYAQYAPGSCRKYYKTYENCKRQRGIVENEEKRQQWFQECLDRLTLDLAFMRGFQLDDTVAASRVSIEVPNSDELTVPQEKQQSHPSTTLTLALGKPRSPRNDLTVAFPHGIGCGLAGGNWKVYSQMIEDWATLQPFRVLIVQK